MLASGQQLGDAYVLVRRLGSGGGGTVWLARDLRQQRLVAVKILTDEMMQNAAAAQALQRESDRAASLQHPGILHVEGIARLTTPDGGVMAMVMEYVAGGDLSQRRGAAVPVVLRVAIALANALEFAHRAGVVHRDLKPSNVLLMPDGSPRVADFGMAMLLRQTPGETEGRGSAYNMSPQQMAGEPAAVADDIYGFGVLLYELLSGYPPFYPDIGATRVRNEMPRAPTTRANVPVALSDLVMRCLYKVAARRPATMQVVEQELTEILSQLPTATILSDTPRPASPAVEPDVAPPAVRAPPGHAEPLRGGWQRSSESSLDADELRRQGFRRGLFAAALVLSVIGVGVVFIALPRWMAPAPTAMAVQSRTAPTAVAPAAPTENVDFAALARLKQQAEERRAPLQQRMQQLQARAVELWGAADFQRAVAVLAVGDQQFAGRDYAHAGEQFVAVGELLQRLEQQAGEVLAAQLKAGAIALTEGRAAAAQEAFSLAQKLDSRNQVAMTGLQRANTLDEVLKLLAQAERAEQDGEVNAAVNDYRKALALDGQTARASAGLARMQSRIAGNSFASALAQGFAALSKADYAAARSAFDAAAKVRPGAPEVSQALKQVEQEERTRAIAGKLDNARELEAQEKWLDALNQYQSAMQLDSTIAAASEGAARVKPRTELHQQLEVYLTQPERLFSVPVRSAAQDSLQRARAIANPGPVLTRQMSTLADWLARAEIPVAVWLQSDNLTQVTIRRVADLGTFEQRSLELAPGSYVVVGKRPGYRDVRREITVVPGAAPAPLIIRCEEKI